jgi:hypothetical protein
LKRLFLQTMLATVAASSFALVLEQQDFTPAQVGTNPPGWTGSFDAAVDTVVVTRATMSPAIPADHLGGDGHLLRVGDVGPNGGAYNWAFKSTQSDLANYTLSVWLYTDFTNMDTPGLERSYLIGVRQANVNPQVAAVGTVSRQGYMFAITANSSWAGITPNPANRKPFFISKDVNAVHSVAGGVYGAADVTDGWHKIDLVLNGSSLKAYIDNVLAVDVVDSSHATGKIALGYYEDNGAATTFPYAAAFDNYLLTVPDPPNAAKDWQMFQ